MMQNTKTNTSKPTQEETQHAIKKNNFKQDNSRRGNPDTRSKHMQEETNRSSTDNKQQTQSGRSRTMQNTQDITTQTPRRNMIINNIPKKYQSQPKKQQTTQATCECRYNKSN